MFIRIVSVVIPMRLWSTCSSTVLWLKVVSIGFNHFFFCPLLWHQLLPCVMSFLVSVVMSCCVFLVSSVIFCPYLSFLSGVKGMTIVFGPNLQVPWVLLLVSRVACLSIYLCFLSDFDLGAGAVFSSANGVQMAVLVRLLVTLFIFVFLSGFECVSLGRLCWLYCGHVLLLECVCLPSLCSPSVAFVGCTVVFLALSWFFSSVCVFPLFAPPRSPSLDVLWFSWALSWFCLSVRVSLLAAPLGRLCWLHCCFLEIGLSECVLSVFVYSLLYCI